MKTILLTLFVTCFAALAQSPMTNTNVVDAATRDAMLRRALHAAMNGDTNAANNVPLAAGPTTNTVTVPPAFPAFPTVPGRRPGRPTQTELNAAASNSVAGRLAPNRPPFGPGPNGALNPALNPNTPAVPGALPAAAFPARPVAKTNEPIVAAGEIDFPSTSIEQVLPIYAELVGRTILRAQLPPIMISLKTQTDLTKTEAIQALDSVLAMNGITMIPIGEKFVKAVPVNLAGQQAAPFSTTLGDNLPEADEYISDIVQLKYAKPTEVVPALTPLAQIPNSILAIDSSGILIIRDYAANVKRMLELIKQIDVTEPLDYDSEVIPIKYAQAQDIASALNSLGGGSGTTIGKATSTGNRSSTGGGLPGSTGYGTPGGVGTPGGIGSPGGFGTPNNGQRTSSFGDRLNQIVNRAAQGGQGDFQVLGKTKIIADQRTNSLLVFASKQDMQMIKKIVNELDVVLAQVLIEAIIMEVTLDNGQTVGFSYNQTSPSQPGNYFSGIGAINNGSFLNAQNFLSTGGSNLVANVPSGFSYAAQFGNDFDATLTAIATDDRINVLSRPRIQTSHGVPASLQVGDTVPEVTGTYFGGINGQASSQYQQTFVGIDLQVTPLINPDGLVVMDISQDVEQLGPTTTIDGNPVPTTSKRTAQATVSVRDRDTIILGGMISTSKSTSRSGVPFLKDIPGLGYLFRSTIDSSKRVELIVLIRPTVLPTPEAAALVATHERNKLPGIKAAERDERLDANKRLKEADKIKMPKEAD